MVTPEELAAIRARDAEITYEPQTHGLYWERRALLAEVDRLRYDVAERMYMAGVDGETIVRLCDERDAALAEVVRLRGGTATADGPSEEIMRDVRYELEKMRRQERPA